MKEIIQKFLVQEKKDQLIFFLLCMAISNFIVAIVKFILSITIPSLWFFVNAGFSFILSLCRLNTVKEYGKVRKTTSKTEQRKLENKNYLTNYGMVKYKRNQEPIIKAIKITNFANALTSIVLTQVVLLDTFAEGYNSNLNGYTGMLVSFVIMFLGLYMILGIKRQDK